MAHESTEDTRFLVIGASGLVGRHIRRALAGRSTIGTHRRDAPAGDVTLDLNSLSAVEDLIDGLRPDVVFLAAADAWVERCEREPTQSRRVNVEAARAVIACASRLRARVVAFSSDYVFDGGAGPYSENDERRALNEYGRQKIELEDIALTSRGALVCRTSAVFGADPRRKNFVYQVVDGLRQGRRFEVAGDQTITPTYARSLAMAVVELVDGSAEGVFHVAGPELFNRAAFAQLIARSFGLDPDRIRSRPTHTLSLAAPRPLDCGLRTDRLRRVLGHDLTPAETGLKSLAKECP